MKTFGFFLIVFDVKSEHHIVNKNKGGLRLKSIICSCWLPFICLLIGVAVVTVVTCAPSTGRGKFVAIACAQLCPDVNHPVCAVDAQGLPKTFANRCFVDFAYCREGKYYVIMKEGEC